MSTDFSRRDAQNEDLSEGIADGQGVTEVVSDDLELPGVAPILDGDESASALASDSTHAVAGTHLTDVPPTEEALSVADESASPAASSPASAEGSGHRAVRRSPSRRDDVQSTAVQRRSLFAQAGAVGDIDSSASPGDGDASDVPAAASSSETADSSTVTQAHAGPLSPAATLPYPAADSPVASPAHSVAPSASSAISPARADERAAADDHDAEVSSRGAAAAPSTLEASADSSLSDRRREDLSDAEAPMAPVWHRRTSGVRSEDDILLEGSVVVGRPASRAAAHWASILLCLVLLPLAWFFLHQASHTLLSGAQAFHFDTDLRGLVSLGIGVACALIALWTARRSSLGACVIGVLVTIAGIPTLVAPGPVGEAVAPILTRLSEQSSLGGTVASMCWSDAVTGRLLAAGLFLLMMGVVSHSARRAGRHEQEVIDRVRRVRES